MTYLYDKKNKDRSPGGVIIYPPFPPGWPGSSIPPFILPKPPIPGQGPFPPVPPVPEEKEKLIVKIKSEYVNELVTVAQDGYLYATGDKHNTNNVFVFIMERNNVKIRQRDGKFVRLDNKDFLIADTNKNGATVFKIYKVDKEKYVLLAPNGNYVRVRDKDKLLVAKAENTGPKTIFKFKVIE